MFLLLIFQDVFSQNNQVKTSLNCKKNINEFAKFVKEKNYKKAYQPWLWTFENCPDYSRHIYTYGLKIIENRYKNSYNEDKEIESKLIDSIYSQKVRYFPLNLGRLYSDWASSLEERGASKDMIFEKLQLAYKAEPTQMSIKNIANYFQFVVDNNKETSPQKVFDTYDDVIEAVKSKSYKLTKQLDSLHNKESNGEVLTKKEKLLQKNNTIILRALSQVEIILQTIIGSDDVSSCEQLLPLYRKSFEENKTNSKWLKRAVTTLLLKECTDNSFYQKLVNNYRNIEPIPIEIKNLEEAANRETDKYKKAEYLIRIAYIYRHSNKSKSRAYAYKALKARPNMGEAYLLISNLYASSANKCGDDEFSKRMVFVAAADKAKKAKEVDPSVTAKADRYIKNYEANYPNTKLISHLSKKFEIKCWIGETVIIP